MVLENLLNLSITKEHKGKVSHHGEIGLPMINSKLILPCGIYGRWEELMSHFRTLVSATCVP